MNCFLAITCVLALAASCQGTGLGALGGHGLVYAPGHASVDYYAYPRYAFEYAVRDPHTGDNKAQWERRDGDAVKGAYSLVEPDGSLRVVEYWADDKSGFNAVVKRVGPNLHPVAAPVAPIYRAPIPVLASHGPVTPISVGPVAGYSGLADAPLISGPLGGHGAVSSASVYRAPGPVVKVPVAPVVAPVAPIIPAPIAHAPIAPAPILQTPIVPAPIHPAPIYPAPIHPAPIHSAPLYRPRIISAPLPAPIVVAPYGGLGHLAGLGHESAGHLRGAGYLGGPGALGGHLNHGVGLEELGHGLLQRGHGHVGGYGH